MALGIRKAILPRPCSRLSNHTSHRGSVHDTAHRGLGNSHVCTWAFEIRKAYHGDLAAGLVIAQGPREQPRLCMGLRD